MIYYPSGVYCIVNLVTCKRYVGSSAGSIGSRLKKHRRMLRYGTHINRHLQSAWNKYGSDSFVFLVLEWCVPDQCLNREQYWINYFHAADRKCGYNMCPLATSRRGLKASDETRAKISALMTPEMRERISAANRGRKMSPEFCKRRSEIMKETMRRTGGLFLGHHHTPESKAKLACKGEKNGSAKLDEHSIRAIRFFSSRGMTKARLAEEFGVCSVQIKNIVIRKAWSHVT